VERIVFVHGSVVGGGPTWSTQLPLAEHFELVVLDRPGFPPNPPIDRVSHGPRSSARMISPFSSSSPVGLKPMRR